MTRTLPSSPPSLLSDVDIAKSGDRSSWTSLRLLLLPLSLREPRLSCTVLLDRGPLLREEEAVADHLRFPGREEEDGEVGEEREEDVAEAISGGECSIWPVPVVVVEAVGFFIVRTRDSR
jgi:hypothetical protein